MPPSPAAASCPSQQVIRPAKKRALAAKTNEAKMTADIRKSWARILKKTEDIILHGGSDREGHSVIADYDDYDDNCDENIEEEEDDEYQSMVVTAVVMMAMMAMTPMLGIKT